MGRSLFRFVPASARWGAVIQFGILGAFYAIIGAAATATRAGQSTRRAAMA